MKKMILPALILLMAACTPKPQAISNDPSCFRGKLVKRGICGQRVIQLLTSPANGVLFAANWTDSLSGRQYENVFAVANPCDFPAAIKEGEEFNFSLTTHPGTDCITCYAYTPVPKEKNTILTGCK